MTKISGALFADGTRHDCFPVGVAPSAAAFPERIVIDDADPLVSSVGRSREEASDRSSHRGFWNSSVECFETSANPSTATTGLIFQVTSRQPGSAIQVPFFCCFRGTPPHAGE